MPVGVRTGAGAGGGRIPAERAVSGADGTTGTGGAGSVAAHRTVRRPGSYVRGVPGRFSSWASNFSAFRSRQESAAASPGTLVVPRD